MGISINYFNSELGKNNFIALNSTNNSTCPAISPVLEKYEQYKQLVEVAQRGSATAMHELERMWNPAQISDAGLHDLSSLASLTPLNLNPPACILPSPRSKQDDKETMEKLESQWKDGTLSTTDEEKAAIRDAYARSPIYHKVKEIKTMEQCLWKSVTNEEKSAIRDAYAGRTQHEELLEKLNKKLEEYPKTIHYRLERAKTLINQGKGLDGLAEEALADYEFVVSEYFANNIDAQEALVRLKFGAIASMVVPDHVSYRSAQIKIRVNQQKRALGETLEFDYCPSAQHYWQDTHCAPMPSPSQDARSQLRELSLKIVASASAVLALGYVMWRWGVAVAPVLPAAALPPPALAQAPEQG